MPPENDDALDKIVRDKDLEQDQASPEDARRAALDGQDGSIPRPSQDGDADADV